MEYSELVPIHATHSLLAVRASQGCSRLERRQQVSVIGAGMKSNPGVAATMFQVLADHGIKLDASMFQLEPFARRTTGAR